LQLNKKTFEATISEPTGTVDKGSFQSVKHNSAGVFWWAKKKLQLEQIKSQGKNFYRDCSV
jgi:hypothetical protein